MRVIVAYDIIKNKIRNEIIDILFENGLIRIQKSVFLGEIKKKRLKNIVKKVENIIDYNEDSIYFFKICEKDFNKIAYFGKNIDINFFNKEFFII